MMRRVREMIENELEAKGKFQFHIGPDSVRLQNSKLSMVFIHQTFFKWNCLFDPNMHSTELCDHVSAQAHMPGCSYVSESLFFSLCTYFLTDCALLQLQSDLVRPL